MRFILLNDPLVLKKNESIRDQEKGEYENNGTVVSSTRPAYIKVS